MTISPGLPDQPPTADDFLRCILRSGLMGRDELQESLRGVPRALRDDSQFLANHLVRNGKLTRFQAGKLLRGVALGMVLGPYRVLAPIGKGGMGTVFLVKDTRSDQLLALKILPPRLARTEERMLARFRREMDLCRKVAHPNIAWTYEVGELRGVPFIAMEYIPGKTLSRLVNTEGSLTVPRAARLMAEVASGLEHAHNQGVIHRDLKPSNILVTSRDHAKILDLGLAMTHGETVTAEDAMVVGGQGYIVGTMDYIAPEQTYDAASVDGRCDVYSLGCTLYFALSGQPPFPGGTSKEKIQRHRRETPAPLAHLVPGLPPGFVTLVERMMNKDPGRRPETAADAAELLRGWATGEPTLPEDEPDPVTFDETVLIQQGPGSTEYNLTGLPELETLAEVEEVQQPAARSDWSWGLLLALGVSLAMLLGVLITVLLLLSTTRN